MRNPLLTCCLSIIAAFAFGQQKTLDIVGIHQLVDASLSENKLQVKARNQQAIASAAEQANLTVLAKLKNSCRTLQQRYNTLGTAIDIAKIGISAAPMITRITSNEIEIVKLAEKNPALVVSSYQAEIQFAEKAKSLLSYLAGLSLCAGEINQMRVSDRRLLFDYALTEISTVEDLSRNMLNMMQRSTLSSSIKAASPFQNFIETDKAIASNILRHAKYLKL